MLAPDLLGILPRVANPKLADIQSSLATAKGTSIAWLHFLAFDLFVGRYIYLQNQERKLSPVLSSIILFFTLMLGPIGFLLFMLSKSLGQKK